MSDPEPAKQKTRKSVSPIRKAISAIVLIALLAVLAIEGRASLGHGATLKVLGDLSEEGVFAPKTFTKEELEAQMLLLPIAEQVIDGKDRVEYRYTWYSMLRPALKGIRDLPDTELYVTYIKTEPPYAMTFGTDKPEKWEVEGLPFPSSGSQEGGSMSPPPLIAPPPPVDDSEDEPSNGEEESETDSDAPADADTPAQEDTPADGDAESKTETEQTSPDEGNESQGTEASSENDK